jgi:hypothetical protein
MSMNRWSNRSSLVLLGRQAAMPREGANPVRQRNRLDGLPSNGTTISKGSMRSFRLRVEFFDSGRNDANVSPELEDQVVDIGRGHGTQGG